MALVSQTMTTLFAILFLFLSQLQQQELVLVLAHLTNTHQTISSFQFLNHLLGCQKGDKVKGINKLKMYLKQFGYLSHDHWIKTNYDDDHFDEVTELAIKSYQFHYNLNVTGKLDPETVSLMTISRCALPDKIINTKARATEFIRLGESHYSFFVGNPKWPQSKTNLTYAFGQGVTDAATKAIGASLARWEKVTNFKFYLAQEFSKADIKISFRSWNHGDGKPFDGPGGVLAHAFAPTDGRLHYDGSEKWTVDVAAEPDAFDIETIGLHELGHILGLGHSTVRQAVMFPTFGPGEVKYLDSDDIQGIKALYNL